MVIVVAVAEGLLVVEVVDVVVVVVAVAEGLLLVDVVNVVVVATAVAITTVTGVEGLTAEVAVVVSTTVNVETGTEGELELLLEEALKTEVTEIVEVEIVTADELELELLFEEALTVEVTKTVEVAESILFQEWLLKGMPG